MIICEIIVYLLVILQNKKVLKYVLWGGGVVVGASFVDFHLSRGFLEPKSRERKWMIVLNVLHFMLTSP